jgi:chitinase
MRGLTCAIAVGTLVGAGCGSSLSPAAGSGGGSGEGGAAAGAGGNGGASGAAGSGAGGHGGGAGISGAGAGGILGAAGGGAGGPAGAGGAATSAKWVMGYYAGYQAGDYPVAEIPWASLTHVAVAFYLPGTNGSLDETLSIDATNGPALARSLVQAAHQNGRLAIASIGGGGLHDQFAAAAASGARATFVANLVALLSKYGYDGLDLDWEPVNTADRAPLLALVQALRAAVPAGTLLTMPVGYENVNLPDDLSIYVTLASDLDQINVMTYGMAGAYAGWKSWHSSALYQTDPATPTSVDSSVKLYLQAGVPAPKLGVGAGFYGVCYTPPVTAPDQALGAATLPGDDGSVSHDALAADYDLSGRKWDAAAHVPYLSFTTATGPEGCGYVSYEDAQSLGDKGAYIQANNLGGAIIWTINEGYVSSAAAGQRSPLLTALGAAVLQ